MLPACISALEPPAIGAVSVPKPHFTVLPGFTCLIHLVNAKNGLLRRYCRSSGRQTLAEYRVHSYHLMARYQICRCQIYFVPSRSNTRIQDEKLTASLLSLPVLLWVLLWVPLQHLRCNHARQGGTACETCLVDLQLKTRSRHLPLCSRAALMDDDPRGILPVLINR